MWMYWTQKCFTVDKHMGCLSTWFLSVSNICIWYWLSKWRWSVGKSITGGRAIWYASWKVKWMCFVIVTIVQHFCLVVSHCPPLSYSSFFYSDRYIYIMVTVPFSQVLVLPLITAKLARNVPTIPFSYASPYFFCINAPLGTQHKPPTFTTFVRRVGKPIGLLSTANPVGL